MASTTRCSARPELRRLPLYAFALLAALAAWPAAHGDELTVTRVEQHPAVDFVHVDADLAIVLSPDAREALESGVALTFAVEFQVRRQRTLLWDPTIHDQTRHIRVQRHALANRYLVTDLVRNQRQVFDSIDEALAAAGQLRDIPLPQPPDEPPDARYLARLRAWLHIESLPAPLRPIAYISPSWRLETDWYEWTLAR